MGRYASDSGGGEFEQCPAGSHVALCVGLIDLGTQHGEYNGKQTTRQQIIIRWETPDEHLEDGQPFLVSAFYTNSLGEKSKLRPLLEAWRGRPFSPEELQRFDLQNILGKPCLLNVIHNDNNKARVTGVMALPKGMTAPKPHNPLSAFWIDEWDQAAFDALPEGFRKIIMQSDEYLARLQPAKSGGGKFADLESDIPF